MQKRQPKDFNSFLPPQVSAKKIHSLRPLSRLVQKWKQAGCTVGLTNGCFDILHRGHVHYLQNARQKTDRLIVALNSDASVRALAKGPDRPVNPEADRAFVLAGLGCVDAVVIFDDLRVTRVIRALAPDIYFKGGDYTIDQLPPEEVAAVRDGGGKIRMMPNVPGRSTTAILKRMKGQ